MRFFEPVSVVCSLLVAYVWVTLPALRGLSLQLTTLTLLVFFVMKRLSHSRLHHILPKPESLETALLVGTVALGVGATGGLTSPFLPLFHLVLFASVLSLRLTTNLITMLGLTVFLWATSQQPLSANAWIELLSLPFLLPLMLFARAQFDEVRELRYLAEQERTVLQTEEKEVEQFLRQFLHPKLIWLLHTIHTSPDNVWIVERQMSLLEKESREFLIRVQEQALLHGKDPSSPS